jgi:hypothetical protein
VTVIIDQLKVIIDQRIMIVDQGIIKSRGKANILEIAKMSERADQEV